MPNFLSSTVISRHDARLSSTTHCALRASRIIYNLTNLSRCYSFLLSIWTYAAPCRPAHFLSNSFPMLSSDSPGTLSLALAKVTNFLHNQITKITHATQLQPTFTCSSGVVTYFPRLPLLPGTLSTTYLSNLSHSNGSQVFQPCNDLWYLPKICSHSWRICLCISISNSERWSRNIVMMSRWFALKPISSSKGRSHSMRTSIVCTIRKILVTFSNPTIHSMYRSSIASRNGRLSRLSIPGIDYVAILSLSLNATVPTTLQWFLNSYFQRLLG